MGHFRGLPGLFVAGIFSGALSTVSSGMNSLAAITLEDFVKGVFWKDISEHRATQLSKILSLMFGVLTFALVFVAQQLGDVLSAALSIFGIVGGPLLGMFTLGMFFPWANAIGCFIGTLLSLFFMLFVGVMNQVARQFGYSTTVKMVTSVEGCPNFVNLTTTAEDPAEISDFLQSGLFQLSYMWYSATGCFIVIVVGLIITALTGMQDVTQLNPETLSPGFHWVKRFIPGSDQIGINHVSGKPSSSRDKDELSMNGHSNYAFDGDHNGKNKHDLVEASRL
ncbi:Sodium/solute symporter [Trinorchestia longiramus]|nr:Sodium/solute symporter [Trinorchestia longiramus]